jgi:O-antigen ligase
MEQNFAVLDKISTVALFVFVVFSMFSISITQIACGLGGLSWILHTHLTGTWKDQQWPLGIPFLLYVLACLIAVVNAYDISYSYESLKKLLEILIFFWVLNCVRSNHLRDSLSLVLIASATIAGLFGFYQAWSSGVLHMSVPTEARVEGTMSVYMTFAGILMMVGVLTCGWIFFRRPAPPWLWVAAGIITACLLLTLTRQAWLGFLIGLGFLIFFWRKKFLLLLPILLIAVFFASPEAVKTRLTDMVSGKDVPVAMRVNLWQVGWKIFMDYPLTGCGFRCVDLVNEQYPDPWYEKNPTMSQDRLRQGSVKNLQGMHNNFIQLAVDTGILGLTTWLGIWICFFRLLYHRAEAIKRDPHECWVIYGSAAAVIAFLVGGCFETNFYDSEVAMVLFFIMALPFSGSQSDRYNLDKNTSVSSYR